MNYQQLTINKEICTDRKPRLSQWRGEITGKLAAHDLTRHLESLERMCRRRNGRWMVWMLYLDVMLHVFEVIRTTPDEEAQKEMKNMITIYCGNGLLVSVPG